MMALSVNVPSESFESANANDDVDLEDGEIEDDEEEVVKTPAAVVEKAFTPPKKPSPVKLEPPIIEASAVTSAKLLAIKNKEARVKEARSRESREFKAKDAKKHSKKHSSRSSKLVSKRPEHSKSKQKLEPEDDWADNVERAIRKAMGKDPGPAPEVRPARVEAPRLPVCPEFGTEEDRPGEPSSEDRKLKKKKRKKKHREEDGEERKDHKRRKKHHRKEETGEEDDDEMLFVRGASPIGAFHGDKRRTSRSPSGYRDEEYLYADDVTGQYDDLYDSYEEDSELEEYLHEMEGASRRGRGMKRGRGRGGPMRGLLRKGLRPRDIAALKKRKRLLQPRHPDQRPDSVCMFFMQGKCQKGDDCPYSHDAMPPRKMELCKFYLMDCCAKKDKCLYMHHDFPCKFHHTGLKCYAGDRCKFSHGPLNDVLKNILLRHLETAPKEILGDFPRLSREGAAAMVHNKKTRDHTSTSSTAASAKSIPSLFDIEVPVPAQFMPDKDEDEDGSTPTRKTTPMPSDNEDQEVNNENSLTPNSELHSPSKRQKNRWDNGEDLSRHLENKQHWDEEIRKQQLQQQQQEEEEEEEERLGRWNPEPRDAEKRRRRDESKHRERDGSEGRWSNEGRQFEEVEKKPRRGDREKKPREERETHSRRKDEDKRRWEGDERRSKKRSAKDVSGGFAEGEEQLDHRKPMMRYYKDDRDEDVLQSQRVRRTISSSSSRGARHLESAPKPLDLDTDAEDKDDLVMDFEDHEGGRKESLDDTALVIDTQEEEKGREEENAGDDTPPIPLHIQKLPKKQQELFLRIQQQQREQQNSQGASMSEDKDEDHQDERWYSSDEDETGETTLTDVLKKLSATKAPQPDPDLAKKVTDLTRVPDVSEAVNKLLTSIGMRTQQETNTEKPKPNSSLSSLPLPPLPLPPLATGPRDPRLSRDPRNRQESGDTRTSQDSPTPSSSSGSSSRADPRGRRRSSASRSIYDSISLSGPDKSADRSAGQGDTDLRTLLPSPRDTDLRPAAQDVDLRPVYGDRDYRVGSESRGMGSMMSPLASTILSAKPGLDTGTDIDLRRMLGGLPFKPIPQHTAATEIDASLNSHPPMPYRVAVISVPTPDYSRLKVGSTDPLVRVDPRLRKLFKITPSSPASPPLAAPALASPTPGGGGPTPAIRADPRRLASQSRSAVPEGRDQTMPDRQRDPDEAANDGDPFSVQGGGVPNQQMRYARSEPMPNPMLLQQMLPTLGMQNPQGMLSPQNVDPRMFRNAPQTPGLLGDAPFYPNVQRYDECDRDVGDGSDSDRRQFYPANKRMGTTMEMQEWEQQQQQQMMEEQSYRGGWRGQQQPRMNSRYQYDNRNAGNPTYTPPPM